MLRLFSLFLCSLFLYTSSPAMADDLKSPAQAALIAEEVAVQGGHPIWVAIRLKLDDHWHAYWKNPGELGLPTSIEWQLPEGFKASELHWPYPKRVTSAMGVHYVYEDDVWLLAKIVPPKELASGKNVELKADVSWLACSGENCFPGNAALSLALPTTAEAPAKSQEWAQAFAEARRRLPQQEHKIQAHRRDGNIEVTVPVDASLDDQQKSVVFFPEEEKVIDEAAELNLQTSDQPGHYRVVLKRHAEAKDQQPLKGVLVVEAGGKTSAWAIETPVHESIAATSQFEGGLVVALAFAFLGGLILNFMPCVLPVISLKIYSFVQMAGERRSQILKHSILFSFGVVLSFWALAGALLILRAYGESRGWGFQLQEPIFVGALCAALVVFALSFFGLFEFGTSVASWAGQAESDAKTKNAGLFGSFLSGILATAVATPCTGPLLGGTLGFAVTLSVPKALLVFTMLGIGMSAPYFLFSAFPSLLRFFPKPGAWMVTFKEIMAFLLLATALWLAWVFAGLTGMIGFFMLLIGLFLLSIACWIYGKWASPLHKHTTRIVGMVVAALFLIGGGVLIKQSASMQEEELPLTEIAMGDTPSLDRWEPFSAERLQELREKNIPVLVDFTAKWCLTCQTNHLVLDSASVKQKLKERGVVKMKADWTKRDPRILEELKKFGRNSVPLYLLYSNDPSKEPEILPQLLTPGNVSEALEGVRDQEVAQN